MRTAAVLLAMVLVPISATAQEVARSLEQLSRQQVLTEGETLWVVVDLVGAGEYQEMKAKLVRVADTAITVRVDSLPSGTTFANLEIDSSGRGTVIEIPEHRLRRIQHQRRDSLWKGAIIGGGTGAGTWCVGMWGVWVSRRGHLLRRDLLRGDRCRDRCVDQTAAGGGVSRYRYVRRLVPSHDTFLVAHRLEKAKGASLHPELVKRPHLCPRLDSAPRCQHPFPRGGRASVPAALWARPLDMEYYVCSI